MRIGNAAADQRQLDIYGELIDSVYLYNKYGAPIFHDTWGSLRRIVDWLCENWDQADEGIWETRGGQQDFTYSRLMCWVAIERAIRMAARAACRATSCAGSPSATGSTTRSCRRAGATSAARSSSTTAPTCSTRRSC